ncbi:MAG: low temperature requirement protein A [Okeania sp. SIO3H1]|nr:low temperature requirement protein A [Okeania sp. SIO3H1]
MEKRASWLELFYDVAFIALVAQLTYLAATHNDTISDWLHIGIIGYTIFIAWWATTANRNLQPNETTADKFFVQLQMIGVFMMSVFMSDVFDGHYIGFFVTLGLVRALQSFMIVRMYLLHPETRPVTYNLLEGFFVASALWMLSAFVPGPYHFIVALMALLTDVLVPLTRGKGNTIRYLNVHHLQERLGLFLMLVIGESMIVVALSNSVSGTVFDQLGIVFSGLALMLALWWLYFEHSATQAAKRPNNLFLFLHAHGLLFMSILFISVGYKLILDTTISALSYWSIVVGMSGLAISLLLVRAALHGVQARACLLLILHIAAAIGLIVFGYGTEQYVLAISCLTGVFTLAAIIDQQRLFCARKTN